MQLSYFIGTFLALASTAAAIPAPQTVECYKTCSTNCIQAGNIRGGICDAAGACNCLAGNKRDTLPAPQTPQIQCYSECSYGCVEAGNVRGGLCDASGKCTCLTGKREAAPEPEPEPQSPVIDCYTDCSVGCVRAGNIRGGMCDAAGTCTCFAQRDALPEPVPEPVPEPQSPGIDCYTNCSVGCVNSGHIRGGMCNATGTCTCYE